MNFETAILVGLLIGPALYIFVTLLRGRARTYDAFHYGERAIPPSDFIDSTIMYSFQVAVISLFATWGYINGIWAMAVPIFWAIGYLIIVTLIGVGALDRLILGQLVGTIHQFIAQQKKFRYVAIIAAFITLFGIAGPAMFEASFVADLINSSIDVSTLQYNYYILLFAGFIAISTIYMIYSGFIGVVGTDRVQLTIGYIGFCLVFACLIVTLGNTDKANAFYIGVICSTFSIGVFATNFFADKALKARDLNALITTAVGMLAFVGATIIVHQNGSEMPAGATFGAFLTDNLREPFTLLSLGSLAVANGLYQLVDVGHWQRLLAVKIDPSNIRKARKTLAISTVTIGINSPLIWALAVVFGLLLRYSFPEGDPWTIISVLMSSFEGGGIIGAILVAVFVASLTAIMFSTLDSLVSCVAFTVHNDIILNISDKLRSVGWAKVVTVLVLIGMINYYLFMKRITGDQFDAVLYLSWSFQISLVPAVFSTFLRPSTGPVLAASMIAGCLAATSPLVLGNPAGVFEISPLLALIGAGLTFLVLDQAWRMAGRRSGS